MQISWWAVHRCENSGGYRTLCEIFNKRGVTPVEALHKEFNSIENILSAL